MKHFIHTLVIAGVLMSPTVTPAWDDKEAKPVTALEIMEPKELAAEAQKACFDVCLNRLLPPTNPAPAKDLQNQQQAALGYLESVGLVAREKNGGEFPQWYKDMRDVARSPEPSKPNKCLDIYFQSFSKKDEGKDGQ